MEDNTPILEIRFQQYTVPYESYDFVISIEKNNTTKKFEYAFECYYGDRISNYYESYNSFEEAINEVFGCSFGIIFFEIIHIRNFYKYPFTKKLIEQLNKRKSSKISQEYIDAANKYLDINLKSVKNAEKKGLKVIRLESKNEDDDIENKFLVGKLDISGNSIIVKNKKNEIEHIIPNQNITIKTENIKHKQYWYFEKN